MSYLNNDISYIRVHVSGKYTCMTTLVYDPACSLSVYQLLMPLSVGKWSGPHDQGHSPTHPKSRTDDN